MQSMIFVELCFLFSCTSYFHILAFIVIWVVRAKQQWHLDLLQGSGSQSPHSITLNWLFGHTCKKAKKWILASSYLSVCTEHLSSHGLEFHEIWYLSIFLKSVKIIQNSLTHCGRGHLNCLNARSRGLNNFNQLLYCVSLKIYNKFANYFCELKFSGNTHQRH